MKKTKLFAWVVFTVLAATGCTSKLGSTKAVVSKVQLKKSTLKETVNAGPAPSVTVAITVDKNAILSQEFLYGADLQYSDYHDPGFDLYNQSMAIGHIPARFRIAGDELQLVADNRRLSASDVNHPELLISRFKILSQTDTALTISGADSSIFLAQVFEGTKSSGEDAIFNPAGSPPRESWIRSFDFVPEGNYLLQQTSIMTASGNLVEMMESIFPRSTLNPGANFQRFQMDPTSPIGVTDDFLARYRFLPSETIYDAAAGATAKGDPMKVAYAAHYDISPKADGTSSTIDWYVTPNIPDETLPAIQQSVEGWNRYFKTEKGIARDVMKFKGKLPDGIHLGDPRYNVINWDSKRVAGAAYESQATDPATGKQSHSLIYMPAAWLQIGLDYYKAGIAADIQSKDVLTSRVGKSNERPSTSRLGCMRDMKDSIALVASGRLSRDEIQKYSVELLKQTLFHEVGHSLGLAHNFKGSLSYNPADPKSAFSTSIMDYNDYEIERGAFYDVNSADGPLLEYDRQAISTIYNQHQDVATADAVVPACNDAEADNEDGGVDPLCIRYDVENDPTHSVTTALNRINSAKLDGDISLADAISRMPNIALSDDAVQAAKTAADVTSLTSQLGNGLTGTLGYYFTSGKASLAKTVKTNVKSLLEFETDILPTGYTELDMRSRAFDGVQKLVAMTTLPDPVVAALNAAEAAGLAKIATAPYFGSDATKDQELATLKAALDKKIQSFTTGETSTLATIRSGVLAALARHPKVSYFYGTIGTSALDYEKDLIGILENTLTSATANPTQLEKVAAATALITYRGRLNGDPAIDAATKAVTQARLLAENATERDNAEALLTILNGQAPSAN